MTAFIEDLMDNHTDSDPFLNIVVLDQKDLTSHEKGQGKLWE